MVNEGKWTPMQFFRVTAAEFDEVRDRLASFFCWEAQQQVQQCGEELACRGLSEDVGLSLAVSSAFVPSAGPNQHMMVEHTNESKRKQVFMSEPFSAETMQNAIVTHTFFDQPDQLQVRCVPIGICQEID